MNKRKWIEASTYPHFTMVGQSLGSVYLAWEALTKFTPQFYFDTSGYAFTYPLARLFGCKVICYTHYPTISSDMVERVKHRSSMYNNNSRIAGRYALHRMVNFQFYWCTYICNTYTHDALLYLINQNRKTHYYIPNSVLPNHARLPGFLS